MNTGLRFSNGRSYYNMEVDLLVRNITVGVTDFNWYSFLRNCQPLEVNFWQPSNKDIHTLEQGELFLFRLKKKFGGKIAGGAEFMSSDARTIDQAWDYWGQANGSANRKEFLEVLRKYRSKNRKDTTGSSLIGCRCLVRPFFLLEEDWFEVPHWPENITTYKNYKTNEEVGAFLQEQVESLLRRNSKLYLPEGIELDEFGRPRRIFDRLGQGAFRNEILKNYQFRCAISGERTVPALEAAHIRPYSEHHDHSLTNGLLLRSDIHKLFDNGLVSVTPDRVFHVSNIIRKEWKNGKHYYELDGKRINVPGDTQLHPNQEFLQEHYDHRFRK